MDIHVVRAGETVSSVAARYGVPAGILAGVNGVAPDAPLAVGQTLVVRHPRELHTVASGESVYSIALRYGLSVRTLYQNNPALGGRSALYPGQTLVIAYNDTPTRTLAVNAYSYPFIRGGLLDAALPYLTYLTPFTYGINADGTLLPLADEWLLAAAGQYRTAALMHLSTLTGGFTGYTFLDMTDELPKTAAHWAELGIHFDAVYTGFMGSEAQMDLAADFVRTFRRDRSTIFICDPVMGDHGKIYKTYTPAMCAGMTRLAELADVIVPNLTEAAVLLGEDHSFGALTHDEAGYRLVVERLSRNGTRSVVLTGVMLRKGEIGACVFDRASGGTEFLFDTFIGKEFHGTGDVFASVLTGALVKGKTLHEAVRLAEAFVRECAIRTMPQNIPAREGVDFEPILWKLHEGL